jgi:uncharacterized protein
VNFAAILITGLFAGGVSCAAVQGGLLTGLIARQRGAQPIKTTAPARWSQSRTRQAVPRPAAPGSSRGALGTTAARTDAQPSWGAQLADDLTPVGGFLAGKLASHTLLGALLGALGGAAQLSLTARTWLQIGAGLLIITFGLAQLRVPGFRRIVIEPPASWAKLVRRRARSHTALAPALLGVTSVLIPCGVTLSVEALALASGSPLAGAATMAVFVTGTGPLFALLGYAARKAATAWRGRLTLVTGLAVLVMGLYTLSGGLELAGSPLAPSRIAQALSTPTDPTPTAAAVTTTNGTQNVTITAGSDGYTPDNIHIRAGIPTSLVVRSAGASGCIRSFTIPARDIDKILPAAGDTRIDLGPLTPGQLDYACGMGMYTGTLTIS